MIPTLTRTYAPEPIFPDPLLILELEERIAGAQPNRFATRPINGTHESWEVDKAGKIYRYGIEQTTDEALSYEIAGWPTIDFGYRYHGKTIVGPGYYGPLARSGITRNSLRLVDEIVCLAFHGPPTGGFFHSTTVIHLDGNKMNCAAENLQWGSSTEFWHEVHDADVRRLMYPSFLAYPSVVEVATDARHELTFVNSDNTEDWLPKLPIDQPKQPAEGGAK